MNKRIINIDELEKLFFNSEITSYEIARRSKTYPANISKIRRKERDLKNISLKSASKFQNYINELKEKGEF